MGETFDITYIVSSEKNLTTKEFERKCSEYFGVNISIDKKTDYSRQAFLNPLSKLIISYYYDIDYSYKEYTISFYEFILRKESLKDFYKIVDDFLMIIDADIAVCSYEINSINLEGLKTLSAIIESSEKFPFVFVNKKYGFFLDMTLKNSSVSFNINAQRVLST